MNVFLLHPDDDALSTYLANALDADQRGRIASHLHACVRCQETLRFLTRFNDATSTIARVAPETILASALSARAAGERRILPSPEIESLTAVRAPRHRFAWAALAASVVVVAYIAFARPAEVAAVAADSEIRISPAKPHAGDSIHVVYHPSGELFRGSARLVLRARLRAPGDGMYSSGVPIARVRPVAILTRSSKGEYSGGFVLPDSIVFASLVVEDSAARSVDENGGRLWEVLVHGADGQPTYDALEQRINDMMGRSWEQAYATTKRLTTLYPDRIESWTTLDFFDRALFGEGGADSLGKSYRATIENLIASARTKPKLSESEIGVIFYARQVLTYRKDATAADSAEFNYWLNRTLREYPRHMQLAQHYAIQFTPEEWKHPEHMLDSLERLYARFSPLQGPGRNIVIAGQRAASKSESDVVYRRWSARGIGADSRGDSAYWTALAMIKRPSTRQEGMTSLRRLLASPLAAMAGARDLREDSTKYSMRAGAARRAGLAALGRALIAEGRTRAGLDSLGQAARGGWDPSLFRGLRAAYAAAGDSAGVQAMLLRMSVDPRTPTDTATAIVAWGRARLGAKTWNSLATSARREMHERLLARTIVRSLRGSPSLVTGDGKSRTLREVMANRPAAVIFWSRHCGFAIEALPSIRRVAERLAREGRGVLLVVDEAPSADVKRYLAEKQWTLPVYYDVRGEMKSAFNTFGTPAYFVLDGAGRIRFDRIDDEAELIAQVDALRSEQR